MAENAQIFDFELRARDMEELDALDRSGAAARALECQWW
jgi:diketogulonate reductase-like aldo/keto reductase